LIGRCVSSAPLPLLTGEGQRHHGDILREAAKLAVAGEMVPLVDPRRFTLDTVSEAYRALKEVRPVASSWWT